MAVTLSIAGNGGFSGVKTNLNTYAATEDATPINPDDTSGGVGQLSFTVVSSDYSPGNPMYAYSATPETGYSFARYQDGHEEVNFFANPVALNNTTNFTALGGVLSRGTEALLPSVNTYVRVTGTAAGTIGVVAGVYAARGLTEATYSMFARASSATTLAASVQFFNSAGTSLGTVTGTGVPVAAGALVRVPVTATMPVGVTRGVLTISAPVTGAATLDATAGSAMTSRTRNFFYGSMPPVNRHFATRDLMDNTVTLTDGSNGTTMAKVSSLDETDGVTQVSADSRLAVLLGTRTAPPMQGTPEQIFRAYLALANITTGIIFMPSGSPDANGNPVYYLASGSQAVPGWTGVIWDNLRAFATAVGGEIALVSNNIVFRPLRLRTSVNSRDSGRQITRARNSDIAQTVEVNYYNNVYRAGLIYPVGGWTPDVQVYQVDAGEVFTTNIPLTVSPLSIDQPVCVSYVDRYTTTSVYSVVGNDGLSIPPAQWQNYGGNLVVAIGEDNRSIDVTITGPPNMPVDGPYRIAVGAGTSDVYSSLRITGTGTFMDKHTVTIPTGLGPNDTPQVLGTTVDNQFISTRDQALTLGLRAAQGYSGFSNVISVSTQGINRLGAVGSQTYPTFLQFNNGSLGSTAWSGKTFSAFDTEWGGKTFSDFDNYYYNFVSQAYTNQAFGNVGGSRTLLDDSYYRITSATVSETGVEYSGTADTLFGDFTKRWSLSGSIPAEMNAAYSNVETVVYPQTTNYTFADFDAMMVGKTFGQFDQAPLWRLPGKYRPAA